MSTNRFDGIYIYIYTHIYIYGVYVYGVYIHMYTYKQIYIYMSVYIYIYAYVMGVSQKSVFPTSFSRGSFQENLFWFEKESYLQNNLFDVPY